MVKSSQSDSASLAGAATRPGFRPDIEGLRAIAVLVVFAYHLAPNLVPGGYVGVDVFFVISGFLITGLLLREVERTGRVDVAAFYVRRVLRLLPAATLVLFAVAVCVSILPVTAWEGVAQEIIASALYVENWWLAASAVDYLAMGADPSPLQHFWSLSVEEQYYIAWPLLLLVLTMVPALRARPRVSILLLVSSIGVASLGYSIHLTQVSPGEAYFSTGTRIWELALGGVLAVSGTQIQARPLRIIAAWAGLVLILFSSMRFSPATAFPGYSALLPTLGTALIIVSSQRGQSPIAPLQWRISQFFGGLSYSLYLWHWPVIVLFGHISGWEQPTLVGCVIASAVSVALAFQSKVLVEDRFRGAWKGEGKWKAFVLAALCILASVCSGFSVLYQSRRHAEASPAGAALAYRQYPGAEALRAGAGFDPAVPFAPQPLAAVKDVGSAYERRCYTSLTGREPKECNYGDANGSPHVVLVGDSHAIQWIPAFEKLSVDNGWRFTAITKSACPVSLVELGADDSDQARSCVEWARRVVDRLREERPDVVVFAQSWGSMSSVSADGRTGVGIVAHGVVDAWKALEGTGSRIVAFRDTPRFVDSPPVCLSTSRGTVANCSQPREASLPPVDPLVIAAGKYRQAALIDMTDAICGETTCEPVVGNVLVWRDKHHMTATYATTIAPALNDRLKTLVAGKQSRRR